MPAPSTPRPIAAADVAITAGCNLAFSMAMAVIAGGGDRA